MNDIDITLYLNAYRVRALADALGDQTAETVEDKLTEAFDTLYQEYVPDEQRASIEARIEREDAAEQAWLEEARRFAVYHIRENGEDRHFTSADAFIETNPVSLEYFGKVCADIHADDRVTALLEFDLDEGRVSVCNGTDNEWQTYSLHDFSVAAYKAFRSDYRSEECRREIFNSSLAGKEVDLSETDDESEALMMQM